MTLAGIAAGSALALLAGVNAMAIRRPARPWAWRSLLLGSRVTVYTLGQYGTQTDGGGCSHEWTVKTPRRPKQGAGRVVLTDPVATSPASGDDQAMTDYTDQERQTLRTAAFGAVLIVSQADQACSTC